MLNILPNRILPQQEREALRERLVGMGLFKQMEVPRPGRA
jgi:hypothetical protein